MGSSTVGVVVPPELLCAPASPYRLAAEAALREQGAGAGGNVVWRWVEPSNGTPGQQQLRSAADAQAQAQSILRAEPGVDAVLVPGLEPPYQAHYFTRVFRGKDRAPIVHMTTLRLAPYNRAYQTAVALCRHFGWRNVALLSSDDHHMQSAQGLRQQLTASGIHIRRHQIFSSGCEPAAADPASSASLSSSSGGGCGSTSSVSHDLDAIRTSGARVVFLLSGCGATHEVLSTARRKGMLRDYAWIVLHPTASCSLGTCVAWDGWAWLLSLDHSSHIGHSAFTTIITQPRAPRQWAPWAIWTFWRPTRACWAWRGTCPVTWMRRTDS